MPRPAKGPRLYLHAEWIARDGKRVRDEPRWFIRDGPVTRRTGCGERDRDGAEKALARYLGEKFRPAVREGDPARVSIAEVLTAYGREHAPLTRSAETIGYAISALVDWWDARTLADVRGSTCRAYTASRRKTVGDGKVRRELGVLSAAIGHWHREHGPLDSVPVVSLPPSPPGRQRWLTRGEAAALVAGALGWYREFWCDLGTRKVHHRWRRYRPGINRHLARFNLLALATGTRRTATLGVQWYPNTSGGWIDLDRAVMHRRADGAAETKKRQPPVRLGRRILVHLRRWKAIDDRTRKAAPRAPDAPFPYLHVVAWRGRPVASVRTAFEAAADLAWLGPDVTPHVLRHTRATWLMHGGVDLWEAAGALGMSFKTLESRYAHHHPDWQKDAAEI